MGVVNVYDYYRYYIIGKWRFYIICHTSNHMIITVVKAYGLFGKHMKCTIGVSYIVYIYD